jgi:hypothetical protein
MSLLSRSIAFGVTILGTLILSSASAQSVIDPADPIVDYNPDNKPTPPGWMQVGKWVRTPDTNVRKRNTAWYDAGGINRYKAYIFQNLSFRVMFPKTYNPTGNDGKKYPLIIFLHGKGENAKPDVTTGLNYGNEFQLLQGPPQFDAANQAGTYDGYVLAPQITDAFYQGVIDNIMLIVKYMIDNNKVDPFHIVVNGLSEGGIACWETLSSYQTYISSSSPMSSPLGGIVYAMTTDNTYINRIKFTPNWLSNGGKDINPSPTQVQQVKDSMTKYGGNFKVITYPDLGHSTWYQMWNEPDFWPFINNSYSSNPWMIGGLKNFWPSAPINETIGIAPGFQAYEWRRNGSLVSGAGNNTLNVTAAGLYEARVKRDNIWSDWSHVPINIRPGFYEAENYVAMNGILTENTTDAGGGKNVGWINNGDWLDYTINPNKPGQFTLQLRLAAPSAGGKIEIRAADSSVLATVNVPPTGDWQNWTTVTTTLTLPAGTQNIRLKSVTNTGWNINWLQFGLTSESSLPVKFVYFNAGCENGGAVSLRWKTSGELNTQRFSVQKSPDGMNWSEVGSASAAGQTTQEKNYAFVDRTASASNNMYRIVEYAYNGQTTISSIIRSNCSINTSLLSLYPNPGSGNSALNITLQQGAKVNIQILDSKGSIMQQRELLLPPGNSTIPLNVGKYTDGVYIINVQFDKEMKVLKLIKN